MMSRMGLGTKNNCAGEGQQQFSSQLTVIHERVASQLQFSEAMSMEAEPPRLAAITLQCMLKTVTKQ
jgi:hypothetical protein